MSAVYADDLLRDHPYRLGSYLVTREDIIAFATKWDPLPLHIDEAAAAAGHFGGIIASGIHTLGIFQRLAVTNLCGEWKIIAGRRISELEFVRPVRAGTTLSGSLAIAAVEPRGDARSLVHKRGELRDDGGDLVFTVKIEAYMARRPTGG